MIQSKNILITGVSTGIGYDLTRQFIQKGYKVFGSVRSEVDAKRIGDEMGPEFQPLLFDVTNYSQIDQAAEALTKEIGQEGLAALVNNAGIAIGGPFIDLPVEKYKKQFEVNVFGLIKVTQAFLPLLGVRADHKAQPGRILQISSVSGKIGMPFMSPYTGSKHALEGISESLRKELLKFGIDVILIEPGPVKTPIWRKGSDELDPSLIEHSVYKDSLHIYRDVFVKNAVEEALSSAEVAKRIYNVFANPKPKTRYVLVSKPFKNWVVPRMLPDRFLDRYIAKILKIVKNEIRRC
jgi:NAD(P)-dependent dehydrogenase (short-subunit alcohol dehydrogenase family)